MSDERKDIENPWNELKPSETAGQKERDPSGPAAPKPTKAFPPGSYGELNYKDEDSPSGAGEEGNPGRSA